MSERTILFICTGNTCRSFMAEVMARQYLAKLPVNEKGPAVKIISAGTGALDDEPASTQARTVLTELGYDPAHHRARSLTPDLVREADLILVMTQRQKNIILQLVPGSEKKVHLLKEYARGGEEMERLEAQARELYARIEAGKKAFFQEHRQEIEALETQKEELLERLKEVDDKLAQWEARLSQAVAREEQQLRELEKKLQDCDVVDPFGQPLEYYRRCANELQDCVARALDRFINAGL